MGLLRTELEMVKEEKEGFEFKISKFEKSAKDLDQLLASQITDKSKKGFGYNVIPSPHPLILNRPTPLDLSYSGLEEFKQPEVNEYGHRDSSLKPATGCDKDGRYVDKDWKEKFFCPANQVREEEPKKARENNDAPIIKDWVSNDEDEVEPIPKVEKKTIIPTATKKEFVKPEKPVRRSVSCPKTSHPSAYKYMAPKAVLMKTGLKSVNTAKPVNTVRSVNTGRPFSTARQRFNTGRQNVNTVRASGFNAVKSSACWSNSQLNDKGFVDSGCSRHMTGNIAHLLDFKDFDGGYVTFEFSFKPLSILQMCDKKNYVLFTDSECLVLSPNFKLPDENQILLKIPRQDNMYSFDMKNIVPKDSLTCLVAKATSEESMLWHRRLGHINFKNINKLVKENLVRDLPLKRFDGNDQTCVACLKGKQHRASCKQGVSESSTSSQQDQDCIVMPIWKDASYFGHRAIGTKWVYKNKKDERGIVIRNKARLIAQGHTQEEGINYDEVFAPVARIKAIRIFLAYASYMGFMVYQMDVKSAFLYGQIEEEVYVCQPPGFEDPDHPDKVYKVVKALYGLHQAPRAWYDTLANYLLCNGFQRGKIDQTLFIKRQKGHILLVQIYVDDIIFGSTKKELCDEFEKLMKDKFQMSSMGELTFFLGLQVQQKKKGIFISQDKYVHEILRKYNYTDVKSASTPTDLEKPLVQDGDVADVDEHLYRSMIGSLMYLTASRPDIMFAVCACARFQVSPKTSHLLAIKRIFRYLKGKPSLGLWYSKDSPWELVAYTDSDYAGATQDRKSTTRGCQFLGNRLISWQCKKQTVVATSTTEAEYVAVANCCGQVLWIQNQLLEYGYNFMNTVIYIENNSIVQHFKTKHIEIRHHFIRDCNAEKLIQMAKIDSEHNVAYLLTKGFDAGRFQYLVSSIGMLNP
ncbi:putative ribonuclease H-like domain-containing protein [Tanacetum coccineum]